jgi:hypothetical protein
MCEETTEIIQAVKAIRQLAKNQRVIECQNQCMTGFLYYQGVIDGLTDILDNIYKIKLEFKKDTNGKEVV